MKTPIFILFVAGVFLLGCKKYNPKKESVFLGNIKIEQSATGLVLKSFVHSGSGSIEDYGFKLIKNNDIYLNLPSDNYNPENGEFSVFVPYTQDNLGEFISIIKGETLEVSPYYSAGGKEFKDFESKQISINKFSFIDAIEHEGVLYLLVENTEIGELFIYKLSKDELQKPLDNLSNTFKVDKILHNKYFLQHLQLVVIEQDIYLLDNLYEKIFLFKSASNSLELIPEKLIKFSYRKSLGFLAKDENNNFVYFKENGDKQHFTLVQNDMPVNPKSRDEIWVRRLDLLLVTIFNSTSKTYDTKLSVLPHGYQYPVLYGDFPLAIKENYCVYHYNDIFHGKLDEETVYTINTPYKYNQSIYRISESPEGELQIFLEMAYYQSNDKLYLYHQTSSNTNLKRIFYHDIYFHIIMLQNKDYMLTKIGIFTL
jgi:hypothetical protein